MAIYVKLNPASPGNVLSLTSAPMTWAQAEAEAVAAGGHLVTIRSATENQAILNGFGTSTLWIGLRQSSPNGPFEWSSGEPVTYTNWFSGEPNNFQGTEDAVVISHSGQTPGTWNDWNESDLRYGVIESPASGLADVTFSWVNDRNVVRQLQPQTISSALEPGRSTYGTFQQIGYPSTVTKKYLWLFQEVFATAEQVNILEAIIEDNTVYTHTFTDFLYPVLRAGLESVTPYTATVRILANGEWLGPCFFSPTINAKVWPVTFALIEV